MKLMRIGAKGAEVPCVLDSSGQARNVTAQVPDFTPDTVPWLMSRRADLNLSTCPVVEVEDQRIGAPLATPRNILCIGLNYSDHAIEAGMPIPEQPILFNKTSSTYCGPNDPILFAPNMTKLDWEVELGVFIGTPALHVSPAEALSHVLGYTVVNDVSERVWQIEKGGQWSKGKSFPNFCPTGPVLVTADEVEDPQDLPMWLDVNGTRMQTGSTATMIFDVATIISHLSQFMRLEAGDLILTGTPPGVGMGQKPQVWLQPGDVVSLGVDGLGAQRQIVTPL